MATLTDTELRNRLDRLVLSTESTSDAIPEPTWQAALGTARAEVQQRQGKLEGAEQASASNAARNTDAAERQAQERRAVQDRYAWLHRKVRLELLDPSPDEEPLSDEALQRRQRTFDAAFPLLPSELDRLRISDFKTRMEAIVKGLSAPDSPASPELRAGLVAAFERYAAAYATWVKEGLDDSPIQQALDDALLDAVQGERGLRLVLEGFLLLSRSALSVQSFVEQRLSRPAPEPAPTTLTTPTPPTPETP